MPDNKYLAKYHIPQGKAQKKKRKASHGRKRQEKGSDHPI